MRCDPKQKYLCGDQASNTDGRPWKRQAGLLTKIGQQRNFSHCWPIRSMFSYLALCDSGLFFQVGEWNDDPV
jgi:hypothetical protein